MSFLPTDWITSESLFSFGTVVALLLAFVSMLYLLGAPVDGLRFAAVSAAGVLNLVLALLKPPVTVLSMVLAVVNSIIVGVTVILLFEKVALKQLARYRQ